MRGAPSSTIVVVRAFTVRAVLWPIESTWRAESPDVTTVSGVLVGHGSTQTSGAGIVVVGVQDVAVGAAPHDRGLAVGGVEEQALEAGFVEVEPAEECRLVERLRRRGIGEQ